MRRFRVLVLVHEDLVPPDSDQGVDDKAMLDCQTEYDVCATLREAGHDVRVLGLRYDLGVLRKTLQKWKPHISFNLLEEFHDVTAYDHHVVAYLELMKQRYTGCNPSGLFLSRDKALSKKIMIYHRIPTARFTIGKAGRRIAGLRKLRYPLMIKSATEDASLGIAQASRVMDEDKVRERVAFIHEQTGTDALIEEYIDGRELYLGVMGNHRLKTLPVWEMDFGSLPADNARVATRKVKWDLAYRKKYGISSKRATDIPPDLEKRIQKIGRRVYKGLQLSGYARIDLRLTEDEKVYVLEANANPELSYGDDFAESAEAAGYTYHQLLEQILRMGLGYRAAWHE
ncbi:MAG: D-alanine--D-alanine ligase [Gammaproteobacteria bacterium]|nr:D-alanine--D-alanine ligase [Gammaproteobacteria bacterium]